MIFRLISFPKHSTLHHQNWTIWDRHYPSGNLKIKSNRIIIISMAKQALVIYKDIGII